MNKHDIELLETAANAMGGEYSYEICADGTMTGYLHYGEDVAYWDPLDDDGDAFRLMIMLKMCIEVSDDDGGCTRIIDEFGETILHEMHFNDDNEYAATRRAIARAAAHIGGHH